MSSGTIHRWWQAAAAVAALAVAGCAEWDKQPEQPTQLPPARMSPDAVVLELAFVRLPVADRASYDAIWLAADEHGLKAPWTRSARLANLFGEQGLFLLRRA